jgi:serine O-acetyltransferase
MADPKLVESIMDSYRTVGGINHLDGVNLPSREAIAEIIRDLLRIIFPGFYDRSPLHSDQARFFVSQMLTSISDRLRQEVQKSLEYAPVLLLNSSHTTNFSLEAKNITDQFLAKLPEIRARLSLDVEAAHNGDPAALSQEEIILAYPGLEAIAVQRLAHQLYIQQIPLIPRMMTEWAHSRTGIDIHPGAKIGSHFFIDHGTGVVIGETSEIGSYVKIFQGVSLGAKSFQKDSLGRVVKGMKRHPNVEDHVTIYANATILGGDTTIGAGSTVAASVFLTHSVLPGSLVFYEEAELKVVQKKKRASEVIHDFEI